MMEECKLRFIKFNESGSLWCYFTLPVQRGIRGKTKSKVQECLIQGIPSSVVGRFLDDHDLSDLFEYVGSGAVVYFDKEILEDASVK